MGHARSPSVSSLPLNQFGLGCKVPGTCSDFALITIQHNLYLKGKGKDIGMHWRG